MKTFRPLVLLSLISASFAIGCGGSTQPTIQTGESIDPQLFKQNAQVYVESVKGAGAQLGACVTQSLSGGAIGGQAQGQQGGPSIESCIQTFIASIKQESDAVQGATLTYLKGVTSPCKEKVQAFEDNVKAITEVLTKDDGKDTQAASKLIATIQGGEIQGKLRAAKSAFGEMTKTCANLAPKGK